MLKGQSAKAGLTVSNGNLKTLTLKMDFNGHANHWTVIDSKDAPHAGPSQAGPSTVPKTSGLRCKRITPFLALNQNFERVCIRPCIQALQAECPQNAAFLIAALPISAPKRKYP